MKPGRWVWAMTGTPVLREYENKMNDNLRRVDLAIEARREANRLDEQLKWMETLGYGPEDPEYVRVAWRYEAKKAEAWQLWNEWERERDNEN